MGSHNGHVPADVSLEEMLATRLGVSGVSVRGMERTRPTFLNRVVGPVATAEGGSETNFEEVIDRTSAIVESLRATGCFKGVDAYLDRDPLDESSAHVTFTVEEKSLYQIRTGTTVATTGDREASVDGSLLWRNIFGGAETVRATAGWWGGGGGHQRPFGSSPSNSLDLLFSKPFFPFLSTSLYMRVGQALRNHEDWSSYSVNVRSAEVGFDTPLGRFATEASWRDIHDVGDKASILVRDQAGHSLKTALTHVIGVDSRDDPLMPTEGTFVGLKSEVAGVAPSSGDTAFVKSEASLQTNLPLGASGLAIALSLRGGVVRPMVRDPDVRICDRFHIGGANSLRGFRPRGVGPRDGDDALGGETFYIATAMVSAPTPEASLFTQFFGARVHAFATAGDVGNFATLADAAAELRSDPQRKTARGIVDRVTSSARVAVGLGIAGETALGRVEINLCNVLRRSDGDRAKTGVQFGLTQSFM